MLIPLLIGRICLKIESIHRYQLYEISHEFSLGQFLQKRSDPLKAAKSKLL